MAHLTVTQRIEILIFIGCGNKIRTQQEVCNLFNAKYPDNPIIQSTVSKVESKFRETGHVKDLPKSGRPKITQDKKIDIVLSIEENRQSTSTLVASRNEVSQTTVLPNTFSDEATFCLNGTVNHQNYRYRSRTNPHWIIEAHIQHPQKLNVWAGIVTNRIIGPFFFEETLTGERYLSSCKMI
ncbi:hypothetical protein NQ318_001557 [Aromia moschata]|uniref:DUF4817 domain-containing protein n=1 Tax=Aromia moschata TaxID=1265417 RepID=A0AAV8X8H3_9CUCU|nr:hypothetical protein NQ318_001557 [Aromia moschata]